MSSEFLEEILESGDETGFLVGPYHSRDALYIHPVFATRWDYVLNGVLEALDLPDDPSTVSGYISDMVLETGELEYLQLSDPVLLLEAHNSDHILQGIIAVTRCSRSGLGIVGAYIGTQLGVADHWRHCGIGSALVRRRIKTFGELPTWSLDTPAYSEGGRATHLCAFRAMCQEYRMSLKSSGSSCVEP